jgi:UDP-GlcNAc3NAcA epimerase
MKIVTMVGARPQFVKAAALSRELKGHLDIEEVIVHTGQHFDFAMSKLFFDEMDIPNPGHQLNISGLSHGAMTGRMIEGIEQILLSEKPDLVLVYGDTNSTLAAALAASKLHIKLAHVEAGLRSFNMKMPEEINRILTDRVSDLLFCPTETAVQNLSNEGFDRFDCQVLKSGDVMQDAANFYAGLASERSSVIAEHGLGDFVLCTLHRAENTDDLERLREIVAGLNVVHQETPVFLPLHPRTRQVLEDNRIGLDATVVDPVGYFDMIELLRHCKFVITDSGGLQKESYFFGRHCLVLRDQTEWVELIDQGVATLVGAQRDRIIDATTSISNNVSDFEADLYGNGRACKNIARVLLDTL